MQNEVEEETEKQKEDQQKVDVHIETEHIPDKNTVNNNIF